MWYPHSARLVAALKAGLAFLRHRTRMMRWSSIRWSPRPSGPQPYENRLRPAFGAF